MEIYNSEYTHMKCGFYLLCIMRVEKRVVKERALGYRTQRTR